MIKKIKILRHRNHLLKIGGLFFFITVMYFFLNHPMVTEAVLSAAVRHSIPLFLGALCGLIGEKSGVMNIGIEGQMLISAFTGFFVCAVYGNLYYGVAAGVISGALIGLFLGFMSVTMVMDQIIAGMVINIAAMGVTGYFYQTGLTISNKFSELPIPFLSDIPLIGAVLFKNPPLTYMSLLLVFFIHFLLFKTRWGLRTRAVGEHPQAADTMGVNVVFVRYSRLVIAGGIAGLSGAFLSLEAVGTFERGMVSGRGFIALAVMIFGGWTPFGALGAALLFGLFIAVQTQLQFSGFVSIPHQFTGMLPYLVTVIVLALFVKRNKPPKALGIPYQKEMR